MAENALEQRGELPVCEVGRGEGLVPAELTDRETILLAAQEVARLQAEALDVRRLKNAAADLASRRV